MTQVVVDFGWSDPGQERLRGTVHRVLHAERTEDVTLSKVVERLAGEAFDDFRRQDDAEVGVNLFRSGFVVERLGENPNVMVYYRNAARKENPYRAGCIRFHGKARVVTSGPDRDRAWDLTNHEEQSKDPDKKGAAVIIELDLIEQIDGSVIMKKDGA